MWKRFAGQGNYRYIDMLPDLMKEYNNRKHKTIGMAPSMVNKKNEKIIYNKVYRILKLRIKPKFNINMKVRISKYKTIFDKGYYNNWTPEIFTIRKVQYTNPVTYLLRDYNNQDIEGAFYEQELQRVKYENIYLVEKVLKKAKGKEYVKWLGFPDSYNSWNKVY